MAWRWTYSRASRALGTAGCRSAPDPIHVAAVAGVNPLCAHRATVLRTQIDVAGLPWLIPLLETALAFHHAVRDEADDLAAAIARLREATATGDFAYYLDIAHFMAGLPLERPSTTRWLGRSFARDRFG